ncbi:TPA: AbiV family abortive infection protein [Klebsiella michiganensis]|uniref:AbiV family abortive infection protein n=1 Tax=Klebsiella michiganensis TaxID=1134687 RepID=UPI000FF8BF2A|nr:AbiV family abortive infection protein [Klebsiella michiganensis]QAS66026.1 hypothetical protein KOCBH_03539 [Klebsiella michiganensis]HCD5319761.1 AbiV family abortive infection protein [Klebsiella michiganensis]HCD7243018.1 AbiV family abortive infection protein [Klebsiella michiganensis]HCD7465806.1 AbiV family abortive infection protein [Klebsiella michiganensis]HCD7469169.1 AbiV family abortive infection protein [Klebsiella michiganensis]
MAKKLEQWKNTLAVEKIVEGMNAASSNARRLLNDASALFDLERYPSATSLAILAIEEAGKVSILREMSLLKDGKDIKQIWRRYRSHTDKNMMWVFLDAVKKGARNLNDFAPIFSDESEHPFVLDQLKQISFYTDCLGKAHWSIPDNVIDRDTAISIIEAAKPLVSSKLHTVEEVQLWVKYLGPVWKTDDALKREALKSYFDAMSAKGLLSNKTAVSAFLSI